MRMSNIQAGVLAAEDMAVLDKVFVEACREFGVEPKSDRAEEIAHCLIAGYRNGQVRPDDLLDALRTQFGLSSEGARRVRRDHEATDAESC